MMSSEDESNRSNARSGKLTGSLVAHAQAPSTSPGQAASPSQALNMTDEIARAIIDQAAVGFSQTNLAGQITFVNERYCQITGYTREELLGRRWLEFTHPGDKQSNVEFFERMTRDENVYILEKRYIRKNGEIIWVSVGPSKIRDASGQIVGGAAFVVDITERKRNEELLRKSSEEIEDLYNHAACGYHSLDKDGIIRRINDTELAWLGYTRDEVIGSIKWPDLLTPASQKTFREFYPRLIKQGFIHDIVVEIIRKDGTVFNGLVNATAIYDPCGDYVMNRATVVDITERKQLEIKLRRSEENLNRAQAVGQIGSWVLDIPSSKLEWSAETYRMFGTPPQQAIDLQTFLAAIHPDDRDLVMNAWGETMASNVPYDIEHRIVVGGQTRWVRERAHIERDPEGRPLTGIGTVQDISERKLFEKETLERRNEMAELQKMNVAAQTAAAFAHELNQPLLAIASYSEAALMLLKAKKPDQDKVLKAIEGSKRQAHRAGQSIRAMLEFLSLKEFPTEAFDLNKEILATLDLARSEYELQFHSVLKLEEALPMIRANRTHIQKVLLNLLHNCIEAMQEAGVLPPSITVTICTIKEESLIQMTIRDNGPGFKKEHMQHLFEPFFTTKTRGIGMGLSISRSLIEANGGQLWVDPQEGPGATFHLTLPIAT
jgi:PAS domain S-box-containing protein